MPNAPKTIKKPGDYREILTKNISDEFSSEEFASRSKEGKKGVFTLDRNLGLKHLMLLIIMLKTSIQRERDGFFKKLSNKGLTICQATEETFSQSRAKL